MKKIEKDLILKDLDYINNEYDIKLQKLNSIVSLFMDEEPEITKEKSEENFKHEEERAQNILDKEQQTTQETTSEESNIVEPIDSQNITIDLPIDIKTLYRKIVMMTHPDKSKNNKNFDLYSDYYRRAIKAKDENDKAEIIYIAYKLKLDEVYDIDDEHFSSIKRKIKEKEMTSNNLNYNSYWIWYHTDNHALKKMMVFQINNMGKRR